MESLNPGVLLLLLEGNDQEKDKEPSSSSAVGGSPRHRLRPAPPAILQITGIVPAVAGPDFCPDKGFYVKLSDASHSTLVSLPTDLNDLILADRLQIGQLIHVRRLENASPVPVLRDFRILAGRHPCHHDTVDLVPAAVASPTRTLPSPSGPSGSFRTSRYPSPANNFRSLRPSGTPPRPPPEKKRLTHSRSYSAVFSGSGSHSSFLPIPMDRTVKKREVVGKRRSSDALSDLKNFNFASMVDEDSDSDESRLSPSSSSVSSSQLTVRSRRSWDSPGRNIKEKIKETKPVAALQRSVSASKSRLPELVRSRSKDCTSWRQNSREKSPSSLKNSVKRKLSDSEKNCSEVSSTASSSCSSADSIKCTDSVSAVWASLPPNLMKHGKEVLKQRDSAVQAATDSLLEAAAAENFIECLSVFAELKQTEKDDDPQYVLDRFLNFHRQVGETKLIAQCLSRAAQPGRFASGRSVAKVALERKSRAAAWIKAAVDSELAPSPAQPKAAAVSASEEVTLEGLAAGAGGMPSSVAAKAKSNALLPRGSGGLLMAANALQCEYSRWFLRYIDRFLDGLWSRGRCGAGEMEVPALLCWLKRVDDWLNGIVSRDLSWSREAVLGLEDEEMVLCERVRRKMYSVLLMHVESAASAMESMSTLDPEKNMELMLDR